MNGCFGKYLLVDLTRGSLDEYDIPEQWQQLHIGGRGIGTRILLRELPRGADPLGPENILIFATGPFQGTGIAGGGRHAVIGKSPKTGTINEAYAGGFFANNLGTSGYDGIIITGKAPSPQYLTLIDGKAALHDARELWGLSTDEVEKKLKSRHQGVKVSSIGPAGEKMIKFACVINDYCRAAARPGFGAVMGSKNLKAVAVKGGLRKDYYNPEKLKALRKEFAELLMQDSGVVALGEFGTSSGAQGLNGLGMLPTKNFQEGVFSGIDKINAASYAKMLVGRDTCSGCPVRCKRKVETVFDGVKVERQFGGPEYETVAAFGSLCLNDNLAAIALLNQKCNRYGLDTISLGTVLAFVMEATEKGYIDPVEGLHWGDARKMLRLTDQIVRCEGLGALLAQGLDTAAETLGVDFAVQIKGQEVPLHDPRGKKGLAISYATSPRGATHLEAMHDEMFEGVEAPTPEIGVTGLYDRLGWENKALLTKKYEDLYSFVNSLVMCGFLSWNRATSKEFYPFPHIRSILNAVTGLQFDVDAMMTAGERNYVLRKIMAAKDGYTRKEDDLPLRLKEPLVGGPYAGETIPEEELQKAIDEYYLLRGFDHNGPTRAKLAELGLEDLADEG